MEDYAEAIKLNPQQWQAYFNRAAEFKELGKLRNALADLDYVTRLNPKFVGTYMNRAKYLQSPRPAGQSDQRL